MSQTTVSIRMDENVKRELEEFCAKVGMNISVAVNLFANAVIREQRIPFDIAVSPQNCLVGEEPVKKKKKKKEEE